MEKLEGLKKYFGYDSFRTGQETLIDHILEGRDILGIMPTGAGKSICYQLPALMMDGLTLVISPLISLMKDQVGALKQAGIPAAYLNSSLTSVQYAKALQLAENHQYKIIYVAPERLCTEDFLAFVRKVNISMVTIDEAHCVSQWGQDFRPSYLKIAQFISSLEKRPVVAALTATATAQVREDIIAKLELRNSYVLTTGFDRANLFFSVQQPKNKLNALRSYLQEKVHECGIVYCLTRKTVDEVCLQLKGDGLSATRYHAGLSEQERRDNQDAFIYDQCRIMVATNAFGMGIDKSNVSFVIHFNMPKNMESYYQEAGRAGRDGEPAECVLFYSGQDVITNQFLIDKANENLELDPETSKAVKEKDRELLKAMTFYCHTTDCLRAYILKYFGESTSNYCGNCSNCRSNFEEADITVEAQKIMSCIIRGGERFGMKMIADILRGSKNQKLLSYKMDQLSTYGIMAGVPEQKIREIMQFLMMEGYIETTSGDYPVLKLTKSAGEVLFHGKNLHMKVQKHYRETAEEKNVRRVGKNAPVFDSAQDSRLTTEQRDALFEQLKRLRNKFAVQQRVPAYIVFADAALRDMCRRLPENRQDFLEVSGVGQAKLEKYGEAFLQVICEFKNQPEG